MPGFHYYATFDESISILQDICDKGYIIVAYPALLNEPQAPTFTAVTDELKEVLREAPSFFLAGKFSRFPVQYRLLESGPSVGKYRIDFLSEGPLLQGVVARVNVVEGIPTLLAGDVSYQNQYRNPETDVWAKASNDVKAAYRQVVSISKKRCVRHKAAIDIYIAPDALELLESGRAQILYPYAV
jgi:hypothetical protein